MKPFLPPLLSLFVLALVLGGCQKATPPAPAPEDKVLFQAIEDNLRAFEKKDVDAVMATIHPHAPSYDSMRELITQMFGTVDLKFAVSDLKVVNASADEAQVSFVQKTEKVTPEGTTPLNIVEGVHTLRPDNGKWKIYKTANTKVTRLEGQSTDTPKAAPPSPTATPAAATPAPPADKPAQ